MYFRTSRAPGLSHRDERGRRAELPSPHEPVDILGSDLINRGEARAAFVSAPVLPRDGSRRVRDRER